MIEAMAAGVPVIAVDTSGVRDVVVDGQNGRLLPVEDKSAFLTALSWIKQLPEAQQQALIQAALRSTQSSSQSQCAELALAAYAYAIAEGSAHVNSADSIWRSALRLIDEKCKIIATKMNAAAVPGADTALRQ